MDNDWKNSRPGSMSVRWCIRGDSEGYINMAYSWKRMLALHLASGTPSNSVIGTLTRPALVLLWPLIVHVLTVLLGGVVKD